METRFVIAHEGMGNFLCPPGHASHSYSVREYNVHGRSREQGSMSLEYAATCEYAPEHIREAVKRKLAELPGTFTPEWEREVYQYFKHCYSPDGLTRDVTKCEIVRGETPQQRPDWHLGYLCVRKYFPDAKPNLELI